MDIGTERKISICHVVYLFLPCYRRGDYALGTPIRNGRFWPFLSGLHQPRNVHIRIGFDQIWLKMYSKRIGVENTRTFFSSLSSLREGGLNFFLWRNSKGAGADPIPCLRRPTKEISVLKLDRSSLATKGFCTQGGSEFRDILYA